jgi:hypothetical protein
VELKERTDGKKLTLAYWNDSARRPEKKKITPSMRREMVEVEDDSDSSSDDEQRAIVP